MSLSRVPSQVRLVMLVLGIAMNAVTVWGGAPEVSRLSPPGGARGTEVDVMAAGKFDPWPSQVWCDRPGLEFKPQEEKGKWKVSVQPDAVPGPVLIRFHNAEGASELRRFMIGTLPEIAETADNNDWRKPQTVALDCVVQGVLEKRNDVDAYQVNLSAGQTLVAALDAHRYLKSPLDACLQLVGPRGAVIEQNLDARDLDPMLVHTAIQDESLIVRVFGFPETPDSTIGFVGGENLQYRLTLTKSGMIDAAMPLAIDSAMAIKPAARGWNLGTTPVPLEAGNQDRHGMVTLFSPQCAGIVRVPVMAMRLVSEADCQTSEGQDVTQESPCCITGVIEQPGQKDSYAIQGNKDATLRIRCESQALGYPLDPVLVLRDPSGKVVKENDDSERERDALIVFKVPEAGVYRVEVADDAEGGGSGYWYRLVIDLPAPEYELSIAKDSIRGKVGEKLELPVTIKRTEGAKGEIVFAVVDAPASLKWSAEPSLAEGASAKEIKLTLTGEEPFSGTVELKASIKDQPESSLPIQFPVEELDRLWITIIP